MGINWKNVMKNQMRGMDPATAFYKEEKRMMEERAREYQDLVEKSRKHQQELEKERASGNEEENTEEESNEDRDV